MPLEALSDRQAVAYFALSLAARPLADNFSDTDAETVAIKRPSFVSELHSSGLTIGRNHVYAVLADLAAENAPALRLIRHAGTATVVFGLLGLTEAIAEGWEGVLVDAADSVDLDDLDDLDDEDYLDDEGSSLVEDARAALPGLGFDVRTPLAPPTFQPRLSRLIPAAKRCRRCDVVKPAEQFGSRDGRLRTNCRPCEAAISAAWRTANPEAAQLAGRNLGREYTPHHRPGSHYPALGPRDSGLAF